jgi:hypothetical protein
VRSRVSGGENLYDADSDIAYYETELAVLSYILGYDPEDVESISIAQAVSDIRLMWRYSSDLRGSLEPTYTNNAIPRFLSKMNSRMTDRVRKANWNFTLARAVKNGQ